MDRGASMSFFNSQPSSSRPRWAYDVFLSFRGEDTRKSFTDHLYTGLIQAGIRTFRDDDELPRGEEIGPYLLGAIEESRISLVVFSKDYASSTWCLDELVKIIECKYTIEQVVLPIFYDIDPSEVRKQKGGSFAKAFDRHEEFSKEKVDRWRAALSEAGNLSGWDLKTLANGYESVIIAKIVDEVLNRLDRKEVNVAKHLVGIHLRVGFIINLLRINKNDDVRALGIHGMGGIGKTTVAKSVFNQLCYEFDGSCLLLNVKDNYKQHNGLVQLQKQLLCDILKPNNIWNISNVDKGIHLIKHYLCQKRVLIVLDDVDQPEQLDALVGERNWFGPGSRIIVTTRDERLLNQLEVDVKYQVTRMNEEESLQLLNWHAFRKTHLVEDYVELLNEVVNYSGGLPLALEVLGSQLFKRSKAEWRNVIDKLKKIPHNKIQEKLKISYDTLEDDTLKDIFLDIACFFVGKNKEYVEKILDGRDFFPEIGINILMERSLITIDHRNEINMHDLVRDMGRETVREISPFHLGKRSRIWLYEDAWNVLGKQMGTKAVEGLSLDVRGSKVEPINTQSFTKMRHLQLLQINGVHLIGNFSDLSEELIWFCWHECPLNSLPTNIHLDNLVVLDMQHGNIKELCKEIKILNKLKILNLSYSMNLGRTPNFHSSSLEKLILEGCSSLVEVRRSIGQCRSLVYLNLDGCCRLKILPESMGDLKSLETLSITNCSKLEKLPLCLGEMESLTALLANGTAIQELPSSIQNLKNLEKLSLSGCNYKQDVRSASLLALFSSWHSPRASSSSKLSLPTTIAGLSSLREVDLSYRGLSESCIAGTDFGSLSSLEFFNLSGNEFFNLPSSIGGLPKLEQLWVRNCTNLVSVPELPSNLKEFHADNCTSMERMKLSAQTKTRPQFLLPGCENLKEIQGIEGASESWSILFHHSDNLSNNFRKSLVQEMCKGKHYDVVVANCEIPKWFSHRGDGSSLSFQAPPVSEGIVLQAVVIWVVCGKNNGGIKMSLGEACIKSKLSGIQVLRRAMLLKFKTDSGTNQYSSVKHMTLAGLPYSIQGGEQLELSVKVFGHSDLDLVEKCGVHVVVKKEDDDDDDGQGSDHQPLPSSSTNDRWKSYLTEELPQYKFLSANRDFRGFEIF